ncbi:hypothetical protein HanRHA438_Chr17g0813931 [Helianthus annuus]|nr:hypothetical protein HanHA300_Chr17g0654971 [Helianthus annuus]KAJ0433591.1 hypothetical protein HanIR_Chr17g0871991 [Helianthus annuus]KAJ0447611.1 hypothetical protein HanHA89_Chr17g0707311 [Helianthus annuus]KAJ0632517.1 hypothetical protein HanLR1_Chr17g0665991 [Helianthus annuus]KAJ0636360.1 hypothetical protein HanOQP8_Chr17g0661041 [Helianthus annuus]
MILHLDLFPVNSPRQQRTQLVPRRMEVLTRLNYSNPPSLYFHDDDDQHLLDQLSPRFASQVSRSHSNSNSQIDKVRFQTDQTPELDTEAVLQM